MELLLKSLAYTVATLCALVFIPVLLVMLCLGELIDHFNFYADVPEVMD